MFGKSEVFSHDSLFPRILTVFYGEATNIEDINTIMNHRDSVINRMAVVIHRVFSRQTLVVVVINRLES